MFLRHTLSYTYMYMYMHVDEDVGAYSSKENKSRDVPGMLIIPILLLFIYFLALSAIPTLIYHKQFFSY